jgi:Malectin domain
MSRLAHRVSANAAPQAVYQSARVGSSFSYTVSSLTPGVPYTVRLHFAEIGSVTATGQRGFNVAATGVSLVSHFDIFAGGAGRPSWPSCGSSP